MVTEDSLPPLWLGVDLSTQSLTLVVLDDDPAADHVYLDSVVYDTELPQYQTEHGMHVSDGDGGDKNAVVTSPVTMWLDAIDLALSRLAALSTPPHGSKEPAYPGKETETLEQGEPGRVTTWGRSVLARVHAVSVSGQQHGTVFWKAGAAERLKGLGGLGPKDTLVEALSGCFARRDCPIWADSSTTRECHNIEEALGGPKAVAEATGSAAYCRFSGNQISRIARREPEVYASCERVSLVSSFVTSLLVGRYCSIDASDASGMNLMDIRSRDWHEGALAAAKAEGLREKLGRVCPSYECQGKVSPFFSTKFGLNPGCVVIAGSGDNPCGLAGLGLSGEGTVAVSLGTSDTIMGITSQPSPQEEGHIMANPVEESSCFAMLVYKNGALSRERVRDELCSGSWGELDKILASTSPGNGGHMGLFVDMPEITPQIATTGRFRRGPEDEVVDEAFPPEVEARAVVEGRFLSMRGRMQRMGIPRPTAVLATGGGTNSPAMMQVLADVFSAPVLLRTVPDAAAIGAALRAKHGYLCSSFSGEQKRRNFTPHGATTGGASGPVESTASAGVGVGGSGAAAFVPFSRVLPADETVGTNGVVDPATGATAGGGQGVKRSGKVVMRLAATPRGDAEALYKGMAERYAILEEEVKG
ncbi:similar to xylulokinase homolog [Ectocarpus siliculosus]|uniref:Xylulose kinase n=1 Tax=Ectocarpus siliculosus TaxID=2880 RepID=D7FW01_ECTSI|nr:similar to xylulokinase homolog [Ectocarpus siliculosus]|eukprot:CBJ25521.1 similar to xylulokinase homolog [Ectocarpus siliculosus]